MTLFGAALLAIAWRAGAAAAPGGEPGPGFALVSTGASPQGPTTRIVLEYREVGFSFQHQPVTIAVRQQPFAHEPTPGPGARKVVRGSLSAGSDTNEAVGFLWDCGKHELRLDLNGNGDLTDDAQGVLVSSGRNLNSQTFTNVHLSCRVESAVYPLRGDLSLYRYGPQPRGTLSARAYWSGKALLQGKDYEAGIAVYPTSGRQTTASLWLMLRPWEARQSAFSLDGRSLDGFRLTPNLFLDRQAYRVEAVAIASNGAPAVLMTFKPVEVELGELKLTGKFVDRVLLRGGPPQELWTVILDRPPASAKVPTGLYGESGVRIESGGTRALVKQFYGSAPVPVSVAAAKPAVLALGGPLTNRVSVAPRGGRLQLDYSLVGVGGQQYELVGATNRPQFAVYRGGTRIHAGNFEFG